MFIIPNYAQTSDVNINIKSTATCFGVNTQSSGNLMLMFPYIMVIYMFN
jgi:hypothetical protein